MTVTATELAPGSLQGRKIIIVHSTLELAGAERQSVHLARYLRGSLGARVEFWGFSNAGALAQLCESDGFSWRLLPLRWSGGRLRRLMTALRFARELNRAQPTVLLPYTTLPNVLCALSWRLAGARFCIWSQRAAHPFVLGSRLEKAALRLAPCVVSNSRHAAADLATRHGLPQDTIHVIPNGVSLDEPQLSRAEWRQRLGIEAETTVAAMLAVVRSDKDHDTVLRAWRRLLDRAESAKPAPVLLLAGRLADEELRAKALAFDLGLGSNVRFLGHVEDISGLLTASDLAVFATTHEGVPNGILEAMAKGLMVVACDHPGIREALGDDQAEFLAGPRDPEALAACLARAARDPALRQRVGQRNREVVARDFSVAKMCHANASLIVNALQGSGGRGGRRS